MEDDYSGDEGLGLFDTPTTPKLESFDNVKKETKTEKQKKDFSLTVNHTAKLAEYLSNHFNKEEFSDVTFTVGTETIKAHKFILAARR
jgi:hypothetical protein